MTRVYTPEQRERIRQRSAAWYAANRERAQATRRAYYETHREQAVAAQRRYHARNENGRAAKLRYKFGLSPADYERLLDAQGGVCAICRGPQVPATRRLAVDHDHATGQVRGLLCLLCNQRVATLESPFYRATVIYMARSRVRWDPLGT